MNDEDFAEEYAIFIGMDPALKSDYYGVAVILVPLEPREATIMVTETVVDEETGAEYQKEVLKDTLTQVPILAWMDKMQSDSYIKILEKLNEGVLSAFRNFTKLNIDYTNNQAIGDHMVEKFGEDRIVKTKFTPGHAGSKMQLMQDALSAFRTGFSLPNTDTAPNIYMRSCISTLRSQVLQEQLVLSPNGTFKFKHKGEHNDLLHAWALAMKVAMEWIAKYGNNDGDHVGGPVTGHDEDIEGGMFINQILKDDYESRNGGWITDNPGPGDPITY